MKSAALLRSSFDRIQMMRLFITCIFLVGVIEAAETWESLNQQASEQAQKGEWQQALGTAMKSLDLKESSAAHMLIAQIQLVENKAEPALEHVRKAFEIDPTTHLKSEVKFHEAIAHSSKNNNKMALVTFKEVIDILEADNIADAKSLEKVAIACAALGDIPTAVAYLKDLWKIAPQYQFHNGLPFVRIADKYDEQIEHASKKGKQYADNVRQQLSNITEVTDYVFFDIKIGDGPIERIVMGLYGKAAPRGIKNFMALITCEKGPNVCYKGTKFHRIIKDFLIQGGDIHPGDGTGRVNFYGRPFGDDVYSLALMHDGPGVVQMANAGPDTNGGQFVVMANSAAHLNGQHIVLGKVVDGMEVVAKAGQVQVNDKHFPNTPVVVVDCGKLNSKKA